MRRQRTWWVICAALVTVAACGASEADDVAAGANDEVTETVDGDVSTDGRDDATAGDGDGATGRADEANDGADGEASDGDGDGPAADDGDGTGQAATSEPRLDPLPLPANLDQVQDVFTSMLGPTEDFVSQMRRIAPDYRALPTPPGAEITAARLSFNGPTMGAEGDRLYVTSVTMRSTEEAAALAAWLEETILADNPQWQPEPPAPTDVRATHLLKFDLPDVEQPGGEQNLTPDLKIRIDPEGDGSEFTISTVAPGPAAALPDSYSGWQDEFPIPDEAVHWAGSMGIDGDAAVLRVSASHALLSAGLAEYREDYLALLASEGLTVDAEGPEREGIGLAVSGHPRFDELAIRACCTRNAYITEVTNLVFQAVVNL